MPVGSSTIIKDPVLKIRDILIANVTDPIASERASDSKFILTGYPDRAVQYPVIIIDLSGMSDQKLGAGTESTLVTQSFTISVCAREQKEKDSLAQSIYDKLRTTQFSTTLPYKMYDFKLISINDNDDPGEKGIRRKVLTVQYLVLT